MAVQLARAAIKQELNINLITHSNGVQAGAELFNRVPDLKVSSALVIAPNTSQLSDLTTIAKNSKNFTLVGSNRDFALSAPFAANVRMEVAVGNLKYGAGVSGNYLQTYQRGHGVSAYFKAA